MSIPRVLATRSGNVTPIRSAATSAPNSPLVYNREQLQGLYRSNLARGGLVEQRLQVTASVDNLGFTAYSCMFYGERVEIDWLGDHSSNQDAKRVSSLIRQGAPISQVAVKRLTDVLGEDGDLFPGYGDDYFRPPDSTIDRDGLCRIFRYDPVLDEMRATTADGKILVLPGSNIVEAAIWFPRMSRLRQQNNHRHPSGIKEIRIGVDEGPEVAIAASPLHVEVRLPNFRYYSHETAAELDRLAAESFERALGNKTP
ncbi:MAG: hypothetical protein ABH823_01250 [bacterium]